MNLRQLRMLCAIADEGSFTAAAERVHTVQSNVTKRMHELESELGCALFVRHRGGVMLTAAGTTFVAYARRILQLIDEGRAELELLASPARTQLYGSSLNPLGSVDVMATRR